MTRTANCPHTKTEKYVERRKNGSGNKMNCKKMENRTTMAFSAEKRKIGKIGKRRENEKTERKIWNSKE